MKTHMTDDIGLLTETDKPTKTPWFLLFAGAILRKNGSARTDGGSDKDEFLAKTAKGTVSFLQNLLPSPTQKEGVRPVQKAFRLVEIFQTAGIGTIYGLLFAGLLLMPFQSHRAVAAAPPAEETVETQALPLLGIGAVFVIGLVAGYLATAAWDGTKWKAKQSKLPKGKVVADTILVVDESTGVYSSWYGGTKTASDKSIPFISYNKTKDYS